MSSRFAWKILRRPSSDSRRQRGRLVEGKSEAPKAPASRLGNVSQRIGPYNPGRNATTNVKIPQTTAKMTPTFWANLGHRAGNTIAEVAAHSIFDHLTQLLYGISPGHDSMPQCGSNKTAIDFVFLHFENNFADREKFAESPSQSKPAFGGKG
jgi:hypothetical protein